MMKKISLEPHFGVIDNIDKKNCLIAYKGFPISFIEDVAKNIPFLRPEVIQNHRLVLEILLDIAPSISKVMSGEIGRRIITFEEFLLIEQNVNLNLIQGDIYIFENTLLNQFPNPTDYTFEDYEKEIDLGNMPKENKFFNHFYINSTFRNGINLLEYKDIRLDSYNNVFKKDFFSYAKMPNDFDYISIEEGKEPDNSITVNDENNDYLIFKLDLIGKGIKENFNLLIDDNSLKSPLLKKELMTLSFLLKELKVPYKILLKKNNYNHVPRNEFKDILKRYWGSDSFRELEFYSNPDISNEKIKISQGALIEDIVDNTENALAEKPYSDIFITAPTGSGKSVLFQIPAIYLAKKHKLVTIVVSPLIALMSDQVSALNSRGVDYAALINSDITLAEKDHILERVKNGEISILYLSPEALLSYNLEYFIGDRKLGLLVIDEAHLVTTWGRDFRIDYWYLGSHLEKVRKYSQNHFPILALTATAVYNGDDDVALQTVESLEMRIPKLYIGNSRRDEIGFQIDSNYKYQGNHESAKIESTKKVIIENIKNNKKTIVYFPWKNQIDIILKDLPEDLKNKVGRYYGGIDKFEKQIVLDKFHNGAILVVLATKAFGMGIDISDIEVIYHHAPSGGLADYLQEIGRVARDKRISGIAKTDFCKQDLKFFKILYGLSSIKQYQTKFALQKIYELFLSKEKKQNMLVSTEDFAFIFGAETRNLDTKTKSTLMLLGKDLLKKYGFNVLVVRPKNLFSTVYACIPDIIKIEFLRKYNSYVKQVADNVTNFMNVPSGARREDSGKIYEISLDKLWENKFVNESFPSIKKKFFDLTLFDEFKEKISPRYKLQIRLKNDIRETEEKLSYYFKNLEKVFHGLRGKFFTKKEFEKEIRIYFKSESLTKRMSSLVLNLYTTQPNSFSQGSRLDYDTFIQSKRGSRSGDNEFRIVDMAYTRIRHNITRSFHLVFEGNSLLFEKYIAVLAYGTVDFRIKMAYLLESLNLATYDFQGGKMPMIFIRINDTYKVRTIVESERYSNEILKDIDRRHKRSLAIMESFFEKNIDDSDRWNYIENYFLGRIEADNS